MFGRPNAATNDTHEFVIGKQNKWLTGRRWQGKHTVGGIPGLDYRQDPLGSLLITPSEEIQVKNGKPACYICLILRVSDCRSGAPGIIFKQELAGKAGFFLDSELKRIVVVVSRF